jgi:hypothetical protein
MAKKKAYREGMQKASKDLRSKQPNVPVVSASQFALSTREDGGASMNVSDWSIPKMGESKHFVGGEKDTAGERIKTKYVRPGSRNPQLSVKDVIDHAARLRQATGGQKDVYLGSWVDDKKPQTGVQIDASRGYRSLPKAKRMMEARNEMALYSMKAGQVDNPKYDSSKAQS